ncbi:MAG: sugar-transfer associated ATP-grasp domain-containing protein [Patescibacteria group bacterium]|nr:sugar-transfer associated ATP-grasp domain-containing protein [Patescibacteria group bacterium]
MSSLPRIESKSREVLGINHRNAIYIRPFNRIRAKRIADDKLLCKKILSRHGILTAEIYKVIRNHKQLDTLKWEDLPKSFALKPNIGTGGSGIIIFYGQKKNQLEWIRPDGTSMDVSQMKSHISNILDGQFSMGNRKDIAIIEERVINDPLLKKYSYKGVPDIRIIVFNNVPIMAELRLPTYESDGKANLHAGGIGVGIDIATGITTIAIHRRGSSLVSDIYDIIDTTLDDNKLQLSGVQIPQWSKMLEIAVQCQITSGLGFLGADIALDRNKGPMVFELNARSGLAIQIANLSGLRQRMERVRGLKIKGVEHGIRVARNLFGGVVEEEIEAISGRHVIGLVQKAVFFSAPAFEDRPRHDKALPDKTTKIKSSKKKRSAHKDIRGKVQVNTGIRRSRISAITASRLGYKPALDHFKSLDLPDKFESHEQASLKLKDLAKKIEKHKQIVDSIILIEKHQVKIRPVINVNLEIDTLNISSNMVISSRKDMPYPVVLGKSDLKSFLIDASKTFSLH